MTAPRYAPGWHPDPSGRHQVRYWDGHRWTEHVGDGGRSAVDPLAAVGAGTVRAGGRPQPKAPQRAGCVTALLASLAFGITAFAILVGTFLVLDLELADDPPGWLRPVAFGVGLAATAAVVAHRKRRAPPSGRY